MRRYSVTRIRGSSDLCEQSVPAPVRAPTRISGTESGIAWLLVAAFEGRMSGPRGQPYRELVGNNPAGFGAHRSVLVTDGGLRVAAKIADGSASERILAKR